MDSDGDLLRQYLEGHREAAFAALVQRHLNLVYRTALRRVGGDAHAAADVTQRVFIAVARKAEALSRHPSLAGWLYTSARFTAAEYVRGEQRRRNREQEARMIDETNRPLSRTNVDGLIDDVLATLPDRDREAVLLHFLEGKTFVEVAATTASSADAVRMRVGRALDRLRGQLERRGVTSTAAALSTALSAHSVVAATLPDATLLTQQVLAKAAIGTAGVTVAAKILPALKVAGVAGSLALVGGAGLWVYQSHSSPPAEVPASAPLQYEDATPAPAPTAPPAPEPERSAQVAPPEPLPPAPAPPEPVPAAPQPAIAAAALVSEFDSLTFEEKNLLGVFWRYRQTGHQGLVLSLNPGSINYRGLDPLIGRHWLKELAPTVPGWRRVTLASGGVDFCTQNQAAVEAYQPVANIRPSN